MAFLGGILGKVAKIGGSLLGFGGLGSKAPKIISAVAPYVAPVAAISAGTAIGSTIARAGAGFRRRGKHRRKALSLNEMGTLMVLGQALGRKSPVVTLAAMKALSGRL